MNLLQLQIVFIAVSISLCVFLFSRIILSWSVVFLKKLSFGKFKELFRKERNSFWPSIGVKQATPLERMALWAGLSVVRTYRLLIVWIVVCICVSLFFSTYKPLVFSVLVAIVVGIYFFNKQASKKKKLARQLPESMLALVASLQAGYSLPSSIEIVARETESPVSTVWSAIVRAHNYGVSLSEAVQSIDVLLGIPEWELVSETFVIQQKVGGNIIPVLEETSRTLRDKRSVEQEAVSATAAGRMSGILLALLAPISFFILLWFAPGYMNIMYTTAIGKMLLVIAFTLEVIGFFVILKIIKIDF